MSPPYFDQEVDDKSYKLNFDSLLVWMRVRKLELTNLSKIQNVFDFDSQIH